MLRDGVVSVKQWNWLSAARGGWVALILGMVALMTIASPLEYRYIITPCPACDSPALPPPLLVFLHHADGRFVSRIAIVPCILWLISEVPPYFFPNSVSSVDNLPNPLPIIIWPSFLLTFLGSQLCRYFRFSNPYQRRQTKWVAFGILAALTGFLVIILGTQSVPEAQRTKVFVTIRNR